MPEARFRFGLFEFDLERHELRRNGTLVRLQAQPSQVLACLLQNAGDVVLREELRQAVWTTGTFVDFEGGLNFCIAQIRRALSDDAVSPRYVRTVPKVGYQFIAPVERIASPEAAQEQLSDPIGRRWRLNSLSFRRAAVISVSALALFAAGYWSRTLAMSARDPIVAIASFDNETGDPTYAQFGNSLTDSLVADLTTASRGRFRVIGNARILRVDRQQRDLNAIAASLGASYVILGQIQLSGERTRVLAHLIHLPEQTHVWVVRNDRKADDLLASESQLAEMMTKQFAPRIASRDTRPISSPAVSR